MMDKYLAARGFFTYKVFSAFVAGVLAVVVLASQVSAQAQVVSGRIASAHALAPAALVKAPAPPVNPRATRFSDTSVKVKWGKVAGVKSYKVLRLQDRKWRVVGATSGTVWVDKGLPQRRAQMYRVVSCSLLKGGGKCGASSLDVSAMTYRRGDDVVNAGIVQIQSPGNLLSYSQSQKAPVLGVGDMWGPRVQVRPAKWGVSLKKRVWNTKLTYTSSNPRVASVVKGSIEAHAPGTALITIRAHNGNLAHTRITVKDFSNTLTGWASKTGLYPGVAEIVPKYAKTIEKITQYTLAHPDDLCSMGIKRSDGLLSKSSNCKDSYPQWIIDAMSEMLLDPVCPYRFSINPSQWGLNLTFFINDLSSWENGAQWVTFDYRIIAHPSTSWDWSKGYNHWTQTYNSNQPTDQ